jgi:hypothetical protein
MTPEELAEIEARAKAMKAFEFRITTEGRMLNPRSGRMESITSGEGEIPIGADTLKLVAEVRKLKAELEKTEKWVDDYF